LVSFRLGRRLEREFETLAVLVDVFDRVCCFG
jgi:hypothetical protein